MDRLSVYDGDIFTTDESKSFEMELENYISRNKSNRQEINRLVFEAVATMTEADEAQAELENKSFLQRLVGGLTGSNKALQDKINKNRAAAQYAAQQTLNKLAEQNMMSFELIASVNNKLNALSVNVNAEFNNIYAGLAKFLRHNRNEMAMMVSRLDKIERNVNLLTWQSSIEYQEFNGVEYVDLNDTGKIVCLIRDFYDITKGNWSLADLLLLKTAMSTMDIQPKKKIKYFEVLQDIHFDRDLQAKLLGGNGKLSCIKEPEQLMSLAVLAKLDVLENDEKYVVDTVVEYITDQGGDALAVDVQNDLVRKYMYNKAHVNVDTEVEVYDMVLDLLYNIKQALNEEASEDKSLMLETNAGGYQTMTFEEAQKLFLACEMKEALTVLKELKPKDGKIMYLMGRIYAWGIDGERDNAKAYECWREGVDFDDVLCRYLVNKWTDMGAMSEIKHLADMGDMYALYEWAQFKENYRNKKGYEILRKSAARGLFLAMNELGDICAASKNGKESCKWYERSGNEGCDYGWYKLGEIYHHGLKGVAMNKEQAKECYMRAINLKGMYYKSAKWELAKLKPSF
ncbi:tetratricopeptide repeat protein [Selenomonas ruminantium]|nr:sel1 repeat family protein [Selenomonas ruminantium]